MELSLRSLAERCTGLCRAVQSSRAADGCARLHRVAESCAALYMAVQGCAGKSIQGCRGLYKAAEGCAKLRRLGSVCANQNWAISGGRGTLHIFLCTDGTKLAQPCALLSNLNGVSNLLQLCTALSATIYSMYKLLQPCTALYTL